MRASPPSQCSAAAPCPAAHAPPPLLPAQEADSSAEALQRLQSLRNEERAVAQRQLLAAQHAAERVERQLEQAEAEAEWWRELAASLQAQDAAGGVCGWGGWGGGGGLLVSWPCC